MNNSTNSSVAPMTGEKNALWYPEPLGSHIFRLFLYAVIFLLTVVGNTLVIFIVLRTRELHSGELTNQSIQSIFSSTCIKLSKGDS